MTDTRTGGIVIGRFMPPHIGHQYLIDFARSYCTDVTVFVCTLGHEPIPGTLRYEWLREMFPAIRVVHITDEIPQASRDQSGAQQIWADSVRKHLENDPKYVFASEEYGLDLAEALGAAFVPVDPRREVFPVSAGMIRDDPIKYWRFIPQPVRPFFVRRFSVVSQSRSVIGALADRFETVCCGNYLEYARRLAYIAPKATSPTELLSAQEASQRAFSRQANRILFLECDLFLARIKLQLPTHPIAADLFPHAVLATHPLDPDYRNALSDASVQVVTVDVSTGEEIEELTAVVERLLIRQRAH